MAIQTDAETLCRDCPFPFKDSTPYFRTPSGGSDNPFPLSINRGGDNVFPFAKMFPLPAAGRVGSADRIREAEAKQIGDSGSLYMIRAVGQFAGSGWVNGTLAQREYIDRPSDGIYDFDFVAANSHSPNYALSFLVAASEFQAPENCKGVRIHATHNEVEVLIGHDS